MGLRRKFAMLFSIVGCAFALLFPAPIPGLGMIEIGSPQQIELQASVENVTDIDATMVALREQAHAALARLQATATNTRN
jgi:hypothetical protein